MSEQRILEDLGAQLDPSDVHAPAQVRQRVMMGLTSDRPRRTRSLSSMSWRVAAVGGLAILVVAGISVVTTSRNADHRPPASAEAAEVLHHAAATARQASDGAPRADQFIFIELRTSSPAAGSRSSSGLTRSWRSVDGTRDGLVWTEHPNPGGRTETAIPGCRNGRAPQWGEGGTLRQDETRACQPDPAYLADLPTQSHAMLAYLKRTASGDGSDDERAFSNAGRLLQTDYLAPGARATLFESIALIPGVTALRDVRDVTGRVCVAAVRSGQGVSYQMLFDPSSYQFLGWQLQPGDGNRVSVQQLRSQAVLRVAVVDAPGLVP